MCFVHADEAVSDPLACGGVSEPCGGGSVWAALGLDGAQAHRPVGLVGVWGLMLPKEGPWGLQ